MAYAKKTCTHCGFRDIQPNMREVSIEYVSGTSQAGLSKRSVAGTVLGSKKSGNQVKNWMSGNSKRQYKRVKKIWVCGNCSDTGGKRSTSTTAALFRLMWILTKVTFKIAVVAFVFILLFGSPV